MGKARETRLSRIDVRERDHRRSGSAGAVQEKRELIDEIAQGRWSARRRFIPLDGQELFRDRTLFAKIGELIGFRFEVLVLRMFENEIEQQESCADMFGGMAPAVAKVGLFDPAVQRLRKQVVHATHVLILTPSRMAAAFEFAGEALHALAPGEPVGGDILARLEIAGMRGNDIEKASLFGRVSKVLDGR